MSKRQKAMWGVGSLATIVIAAMILAGVSGCWNKSKKPPVILVIIDTLPAGHSSAYGYERSTTSSLKALAQDGITFKHAISASPWTLPSIASILTGSLPSRHKAGLHLDPWTMKDRRLSVMNPERTTLAQLFKEQGYRTAGFFNNPFTHPEYGLNKGFDVYDYVGGDNMENRSAPDVLVGAISWINEFGDKPFFLVIHFFDPHMAYNPPLEYAAPYVGGYKGDLRPPFAYDPDDVKSGKIPLDDEDKEFVKGLYDGEVAFTDTVLDELIAYLKQRELYDPSLIIVTADHGEEFWEHGGFEHGHTLYRELLEVPLVIKFPGISHPGAEVTEYVSLMDIFPTIAEFMGWPLPFAQDGVSLYPRGGKLYVTPHVIVAENVHYGPQKQCFYADKLKLIVDRETAKITIYDLEKDPGETKNVFGEVKLSDHVKSQVEHIAKDIDKLLKEDSQKAAQLDAETIRMLKSLGYVSK